MDITDEDDYFWGYDSRKLLDIDWNPFTEEELHRLLVLNYETLGYKVYNQHDSDRSNENGADIVAVRGKESIAIAVKVKPKGNDYWQALELASRGEKKKIYCYIQTPVAKFLNKMRSDPKLKSVEFKTMSQFLRETLDKNPSLFMDIILSNNTTIDYYENMISLQFGLIWKSAKADAKHVASLSNRSLSELWRLKDIAVDLNKTSQNLLLFYEGRKIKDKEHELQIFMQYMHSYESLIKTFNTVLTSFCKNNLDFLRYNAEKTKEDSDWLDLVIKKNALRPGKIETYLKDYQKMKKALQLNSTRRLAGSSLSEIFCHNLRGIHSLGSALEFRIDMMYKQYNGEEIERGKRHI